MSLLRGGGWHGPALHAQLDGARPKIERRMLRRVAGYGLPYKRLFAAMLLCLLIISVVELVPPLIYRELIDNVIPNRDLRLLNFLAIALLAVPLASGAVGLAQRYLSARVGEGIIFDLRQQMYEHMQRMPLRFFTSTKSGEIIARFSYDVVGAQNAITSILTSVATSVFTLVGTLTIMLNLDWRLTVLALVVVPLFIFPTWWLGRVLRRLRRRSMELNTQLTSAVTETLNVGGALLVKSFGGQERESQRFRQSNLAMRDIGVKEALMSRWLFMSFGLAGSIGVALVYWGGGHLVLRGGLTVGTIVAFAAYLMRLYQPISSLANLRVEFISALVSFERVFQYLDLPLEVEDQPGAIEVGRARAHIRFEDLSFTYRGLAGSSGEKEEGKDRFWALRHVSFETEPGQMVALVGPSGAGKTTVSYLLHRFYDPTEGRITLDGLDLRHITQASLARQIGMVTQEPHLFHDTIRSNLLYAKPQATQGELEAACRAAEIHSFIQSLPQGYDTIVGERGYQLSGGERQRLAIARAILKDPPLLILDEATSHLDSESESLIQNALRTLLQGRTSLIIAHRLSTILAADLIVVLDRGQVVEMGNHAQLLARHGLYSRLYEAQFLRQPAGSRAS